MADVTGTYGLVSINGQGMPTPYGQSSDIVFDTVTFARDGTWTDWEGGGELGSAVVTDRGRYSGTWTLDAAGGRVLQTSTDRYGNATTLPLLVKGHGATLTYDAGPVDPARPGTGLWLYDRVP